MNQNVIAIVCVVTISIIWFVSALLLTTVYSFIRMFPEADKNMTKARQGALGIMLTTWITMIVSAILVIVAIALYYNVPQVQSVVSGVSSGYLTGVLVFFNIASIIMAMIVAIMSLYIFITSENQILTRRIPRQSTFPVRVVSTSRESRQTTSR